MTDSASGSRPAYARIALRKNLARSIRGGHPWIYRDALKPVAALDNGALVLITTPDGRPLGRGFWTADSPLAVRMLTTNAADQIDSVLGARLLAALDRRLVVIDREQTNAFRWVHGEADQLPGLHLDIYGAHGSVRFDGPGARAFYQPLIGEIATVGARIGLRSLVERVARKRGGAAMGSRRLVTQDRQDVERVVSSVAGSVGGDEGGDDATTTRALFGEVPTQEIEVCENGLRFGVDLAHGQKGGLFLDQRDNRQRVRGLSRGLRVLNLFGYTGGFSVYAAAGGATATVTVDSSAGAIRSAGQNFARNDLPVEPAQLIVADVFAFLAEAARRGERWDLVISDPPSFAPSRRALPDALRAYRRLHRMCAAVVERGGLFCAASCSSHVDEEAFVASVVAGCADGGKRFDERERHGPGPDHPAVATFPEGHYLKFVVGTVGGSAR